MMPSNYSVLKNYWNVGLAFAIGGASVLLSREAFKAELSRGILPAVILIAVLVLTVARFVLYLIATEVELDLARDHHYLQQIGEMNRAAYFVIIIVLSLCFGAQIAYVTNLQVYAAISFALQMADCIGGSVAREKFVRAYFAMTEKKHSIPEAIREYYINRPIYPMYLARVAAFAVAFILAVVAYYRPSEAVTNSAWGVIIVSILVPETIVGYWRWKRDSSIEKGSHAHAGAGR